MKRFGLYLFTALYLNSVQQALRLPAPMAVENLKPIALEQLQSLVIASQSRREAALPEELKAILSDTLNQATQPIFERELITRCGVELIIPLDDSTFVYSDYGSHEANATCIHSLRTGENLPFSPNYYDEPLVPLGPTTLGRIIGDSLYIYDANKIYWPDSDKKPDKLVLEGLTDSYADSKLTGPAINIGNNKIAYACNRDNNIKIWDTTSGKLLHDINAQNRHITNLLMVNAKTILSSSWDRTIKIWDSSTGELIREFTDWNGSFHKAGYVAVIDEDTIAYNQSTGTDVYTLDKEYTIKVCSIKTGECLRTFTIPRIYSMSSLNNGKLLITFEDGAKIVDAKTFECEHNLSKVKTPDWSIKQMKGTNSSAIQLGDFIIAPAGPRVCIFKMPSSKCANLKDNALNALNDVHSASTFLVSMYGTNLPQEYKTTILKSIKATGSSTKKSIKDWIKSIQSEDTKKIAKRIFKNKKRHRE